MKNPSSKHKDNIVVVKSGKKLSALDVIRGAHLKMLTIMKSRT